MKSTVTSENLFILQPVIDSNTARITKSPRLPREAQIWNDGARISVPIIQPLKYEIDEFGEGVMPSVFNTAAPLMSNRLIDTFVECGAVNLEVFPATIIEVSSGSINLDYSAVNVVGIISLAKESDSYISSLNGLGNWISKFVVDDSKVPDIIAFQLFESPGKIVIQKNLKEAIEEKSFPLLDFIPINNFTG